MVTEFATPDTAPDLKDAEVTEEAPAAALDFDINVVTEAAACDVSFHDRFSK